MTTHAFSFIPLPERPAKPRSHGLTLLTDWGLPSGHQEDVLASHGFLIDAVHFAVSLGTVLPREAVRKKNALYQEYAVSSFSSSLFTELALRQKKYTQFLEEVVSLGFSGIVFSQTQGQNIPEEKIQAIQQAVSKTALTAVAEVEYTSDKAADQDIISRWQRYLDAGCSMLILDARKLFDKEKSASFIESLIKAIPLDKLLFELPTTVLPDMSKPYKTQLLFQVMSTFGIKVNVAGIEWDEVCLTEMIRNGTCCDIPESDPFQSR